MTSNIYTTHKQQSDVIRAFFESSSSRPLIIIRDVELIPEIEAMIQALNPDRVGIGKVVAGHRGTNSVLYLLTRSSEDVSLALSLQACIGAHVARFRRGRGA